MNPPGRGRRWPLHPRPGPGEALSSWLDRTAEPYGMFRYDLLRHGLGGTGTAALVVPGMDLDWDPPPALLAALAESTGVPLGELATMTIAGWVPWLTDTLDAAGQQQELFDTYVRQESVLLAPGQAGRNFIRPAWRGPWLPPARSARRQRGCPVCATDPDRGIALMGRLPLMTSCAEHGCRLEPADDLLMARLRSRPLPPAPVDPHVARLDRYTHECLMSGQVTLPGRTIHVGQWLRLLRTLLDEVCASPTRVSARSARTLHRIWDQTGRPARAGLPVWRPYELMDWPMQEAMLQAAAVACHLVQTQAIEACGTLGPALAFRPHRPVYAGDQPDPAILRWREIMRGCEAAMAAARCDLPAARQMLILFTHRCRTVESFHAERQFLIDVGGIPAELLPGPAELGRSDLLTADRPVPG